MKIYRTFYQSAIGLVQIEGTAEAITAVEFADEGAEPAAGDNLSPVVAECVQQFDEYFAGKRTDFDLKLHLGGTPFQKTVWNELTRIPFGQTISYGELARRIGNPKAMRAVGAANGKNIINIIVPCHRVIGSNGKLTGYGGGLWRKEWLLAHEKKVIAI